MITYKHDIYVLPHELWNDLSLRIFGNEEVSRKCLSHIEWQPSAQFAYQIENFVNTGKNASKTEIKLSLYSEISHKN